jgi:hypothetical protein
MTRHGFLGRNLINDPTERAVSLTLIVFVLLFSTFSHADAPPLSGGAAQINLGDVTGYLRQQGMKGAALLPGDMRRTLSWFSGDWHAVTMTGDAAEEASGLASSDNAAPIQLETNFHHKGFLPMHDALTLGSGVGGAAFDDKLQFAARPFYGQSWHSLRHYYGGEVTMNIARRSDGMPWGQITMHYTDGESTLTDHGRGIDLHGDVDLTNGWRLTSGIRQNDLSGNANYVSLRWKLGF